MIPRHRLSAPALAAALTLSCSAAPPHPEERRPIDPAGFPIEPPAREDGSLATAIVARKPAALKIDGDLSEWGDLAPPAGPPPPPPPKQSRTPGSRPFPYGGGSPTERVLPGTHLAIAFTPEGAALAGELQGPASDGVWLVVRFGDPPLPPLGEKLGDGQVIPLRCDATSDGAPLPPKDAAACEALLQAHAEAEQAHAARFRRAYRIDKTGVRVTKDDGTLAYVHEAQFVFRTSGAAMTFEATLPAKALPRTESAPLVSAGVAAAVLPEGAPSPELAAERVPLPLPEPVGFEPHAKLRQAVFEVAEGEPPGGYHLSYQPGDDLETEDIVYANGDLREIRTVRTTLYERDSTFGALEVGFSTAGGRSLVVLSRDEVKGVSPLPGAFAGRVAVGDEMHFFSSAVRPAGEAEGAVSAVWTCVAVRPDGELREALVDRSSEVYLWTKASPFHSSDFAAFGITGRLALGDPVDSTATWSYSAETRTYLLKLTEGRSLPKGVPDPDAKPRPPVRKK